MYNNLRGKIRVYDEYMNVMENGECAVQFSWLVTE